MTAPVAVTERSEPRQALPLPLRPEECAVIEALRGLAFGSVEITVHESRIVQIARTQKLRV